MPRNADDAGAMQAQLKHQLKEPLPHTSFPLLEAACCFTVRHAADVGPSCVKGRSRRKESLSLVMARPAKHGKTLRMLRIALLRRTPRLSTPNMSPLCRPGTKMEHAHDELDTGVVHGPLGCIGLVAARRGLLYT